MTDYPPGKWSSLLVGAWWPSGASINTALKSGSNRATIATTYEDYGGLLGVTLTGALLPQEGSTAHAAQDAFRQGKSQAEKVAECNLEKASSYTDAVDALVSLRSSLSEIAAQGNEDIEKTLNASLITDKINTIVGIIAQKNQDAERKSGESSLKIKSAIETALRSNGDYRTAEEFGRANKINLPAPPTEDVLKEAVTSMLTGQTDRGSLSADLRGGSTVKATDAGASPVDLWSSDRPSIADGSFAADQRAGTSVGSPAIANPSREIQSPVSSRMQAVGDTTHQSFFRTDTSVGGSQPGATPSSAAINPGSITANGAPGALSSAGSLTSATGGSPSLPSSTGSLSGAQPLSPESLAQSFTSGMQAGAPVSAGAEALSEGISETVQSQAAQPSPPPISSSPTVASSGFAFEAPQHHSEPAPAPAPPADPQHQPVYAAPVAAGPTAAAPMAAVPPAAPAGPLPTYGSDLRPATAAAPPPSAAAPLSAAPVNPASGTAASSQPAVVRQQPTTAAAATAPAGLVENAMTAAATGAAAGAASEQATTNARLHRLLEAVARQEPKLRWAIGDREDGTTILVTDLASGWIPPHVEIPTGVELLGPAKRRGSVEHLLGETTNFALWTPGHYLPPAKDADPVQMSFRARQVPDINDLNWEITQATNWRDGLPRLAHTLTKAGIAGTGVLETESDLLYEHLTGVRDKVVKSYPDTVDAMDVGNWQLLAAIGALIAKDSTTLKYHFAWFQALSMATQGGTR